MAAGHAGLPDQFFCLAGRWWTDDRQDANGDQGREERWYRDLVQYSFTATYTRIFFDCVDAGTRVYSGRFQSQRQGIARLPRRNDRRLCKAEYSLDRFDLLYGPVDHKE